MFDMDIALAIKRLCVAFVPLMLGIILHEVAHGWVASKRGDPTAAALGRLTLNPVPHIDPMGLFVFVLTSLTSPFVFGWAKPVPINVRNFRHVVKDIMLVSFAGPATNFLLALFFAVLLRLLITLFPLAQWQDHAVWSFFFLMFHTGIGVNFGLGWLNLLPIPPLDGSKILWGLLPPKLGFQYMQLERYGFVILILLIVSGALSAVLMPLIELSFNLAVTLIVTS
ncbi:MAG: site-2 protease family protein [Bilophila sp.]